MLFLLVYQLAALNVCSPFLTQLVAGSSRRDHVTSLLRYRHWLPVKQRVEYKLCTIVHRCLYGDHPTWSTSSRRLLLQVPELV